MIRHALIFWISVCLAVFGVVSGIMLYGFEWLFWEILPIALMFGLLLLGYKLIMKDRRRGPGGSRTKVKPSQKTMSKVAGVRKAQPAPGKRKTYPFQVIEGSKGKNDDQYPKYH
ncbi:hypothetical protein C2I18_02695 [Paenibacillus sp. PK3_47]|uniref:hypothetical protein n=1 Tax=Paenibacillus sp. PK3_47 TaxID=2072642 RepID=UPI00201D6DFB|nr:hypothetical protein [Paenibacillus sp. PK3_47]UQZ32558.1 hypothetical protein C2I18_02695 [Paenibacillus sp. PK3_47]